LTQAEEASAPAWAKDDGASVSEVAIKASDGIPLKAWEVVPEDANGDMVILLHGRGGNRLEMKNYADFLLAHGYSVLMPDARGHGNSGGGLTSSGLLERNDIHLWVQWLITNRRPSCLYGFGESMGAAQLLQSLQVEPRFCAVAAECPFSTFREIAYDRMGQPFHLGPWVGRTLLRPAVEVAFLYVRLRYRLDMNQVSPEDSTSHTSTPVLLIHGQSDTNIPVRHSRRMATRNRGIALWEVPNTGHSNAVDTSPHELETNLVNWFSNHQRNPSSDPAQATVSPQTAPVI
jgi:alpha-beta hydrolase superfamily lysophospholipase